jgi:UDP-N-acetyl-2-amino-2-deoxyglucuronate dehydrogenase
MIDQKNFAVIGAAGYIAPRHLKAIQETGNRIVAVLDPHDSVGRLDSYSYDIDYFSEAERLERCLQKLRFTDSPDKVDWVSVCSPNYLHDSHCRLGLEAGANVICEKPLTLNTWNLDLLHDMEERTGKRIYTVLQLRLQEELVKLKERIDASDDIHYVEMKYITPRGRWYHESWKGDVEKSGGLITNIGIHLLDMLIWLFGDVYHVDIHSHGDKYITGEFFQKKAKTRWGLSIDPRSLPEQQLVPYKPVRTLWVDGVSVDFTGGFTDLHTEVYKKTLGGDGFTIEDARPALVLAQNIRSIITMEEK